MCGGLYPQPRFRHQGGLSALSQPAPPRFPRTRRTSPSPNIADWYLSLLPTLSESCFISTKFATLLHCNLHHADEQFASRFANFRFLSASFSSRHTCASLFHPPCSLITLQENMQGKKDSMSRIS